MVAVPHRCSRAVDEVFHKSSFLNIAGEAGDNVVQYYSHRKINLLATSKIATATVLYEERQSLFSYATTNRHPSHVHIE